MLERIAAHGHPAAAGALPGRGRLDIFLQQVINGLTLGSVYAVVALGYTMVYGIIQLINFAHGEVVMIGAMVSFSVITAARRRAHSACRRSRSSAAGVLVAIPVCMARRLHAGARRLPAAAHGAAARARSSPRSACRSSCSTSR